jgi:DNA (cytosine-5)-methyltransferase 1
VLTIGSLFSGIDGLALGLLRAGLGPVVFQVELDEFCRKILAKHWPDAIQHSDITTVDQLPYVDVLIGGFPCTDISNAGRREGISGPQSGLWHHYARIIRMVRPRYVVVENVAALAHRGMGLVLGDLAASGYDAVWDCIPAAAVGAPHRRDRFFLVAWRIPDADRDTLRDSPERRTGAGFPPYGWNPFAEHLGGNSANGDRGRRGEEELVDADCARPQGEAFREVGEGGEMSRRGRFPPAPDDMHAWWGVPTDSQPAICRVAAGLSPELDAALSHRIARLRAIGNSVVPQVAEVVGRALLSIDGGLP